MNNVRCCSRCILDTTVTDIWFDDKGVCKYCYIHDEMDKTHPLGKKGEELLENKIRAIKEDGKGKKYDCIVGVSGGRDSTYTLLTAVKLGLRPLAVHFDNGWNSEIAVENIKKATNKLNVDLHTVVADWDEMKSLQRAFLKASVPDADVPTDYAIYSVLFEMAVKEKVKYILNGHSYRTEGTSPVSWTYMDGRYIKDVLNKFGEIKMIKSFPILSMSRLIYITLLKKIKEVRLMEFIDYRKKEVDKVLELELDWQYYGGHHHENTYTEFFQSFLLPNKFKIDKRKTELSAMVRTKQISREEALDVINHNRYEYNQEVVDYAISKLGFSKVEFEEIFNYPIKSFNDFKSYYAIIKTLHYPIKIACDLHLLPKIFYLKYAK